MHDIGLVLTVLLFDTDVTSVIHKSRSIIFIRTRSCMINHHCWLMFEFSCFDSIMWCLNACFIMFVCFVV